MWALLGIAALSILGGLGVRDAVQDPKKDWWKGVLGLGALWAASGWGAFITAKYAAGAVFQQVKAPFIGYVEALGTVFTRTGFH